MSYCDINSNKEHLLKLIDLIYNEVLSSGGDGDAFWYSRYYNVDDIKILVEEYNSKLKWPWEVYIKNNILYWGQDQEWAMITNDKSKYDSEPEYTQMKIIY